MMSWPSTEPSVSILDETTTGDWAWATPTPSPSAAAQAKRLKKCIGDHLLE